ncbi:MAG: rhodanese-like domain-containing protein [Deltaproteobacteria bacterium]|nr:rhodanese-like domain-containing protein [Deltaproteobacteria bacterium]
MLKRLLKTGIVIVAAFLLIPAGLMAAQFKGKIQSISKKAKTIQVLNLKTKKIEVIRFGDKTQFINAKSIKEFIPKDVILVDYEHGKAATSIKRVLVELPPEKIIKTQEIAKLLQGPASEYMLVDARPGKAYNAGHLPTAISIFTKEMKGKMNLLPKDKNRLLIFYCGGPT